jgi:hypothetical protein
MTVLLPKHHKPEMRINGKIIIAGSTTDCIWLSVGYAVFSHVLSIQHKRNPIDSEVNSFQAESLLKFMGVVAVHD